MNQQQQIGKAISGDIGDECLPRLGIAGFLVIAKRLLLEDSEIEGMFQAAVRAILQDFDKMVAGVGEYEIDLPIVIEITGHHIRRIGLFELALEGCQFAESG